MAMLTLLSMGYEVLVDGCFNADPHPGNILYLAKTEQLGLIDYGQVKRLTELERLNCAKVRRALCQATSHSAPRSVRRGASLRRVASRHALPPPPAPRAKPLLPPGISHCLPPADSSRRLYTVGLCCSWLLTLAAY